MKKIEDSRRFQIIVENAMMKKIEDYKYKHRLPSNIEAIRALVSLGLRAGVKAKREGK